MDWIKCSERLPEQSGEYLVASPIVYSTGRKDFIYSVISYSAKHKLFCCSDYDDISKRESPHSYDDVEYWMPIPEVEE
jgi:hypothetical protein